MMSELLYMYLVSVVLSVLAVGFMFGVDEPTKSEMWVFAMLAILPLVNILVFSISGGIVAHHFITRKRRTDDD